MGEKNDGFSVYLCFCLQPPPIEQVIEKGKLLVDYRARDDTHRRLIHSLLLLSHLSDCLYFAALVMSSR